MHGIEADRWELLLRNEYAGKCAEEMIAAGSICKGSEFLGGCIDFVEPGENWYGDRRYKFWESLLKEIGDAKLRAPREAPTLERALDWLDRQVSPTVSVLLHGFGKESFLQYLYRLADGATGRLSEHHLAWIQQLQNSEESIL